MIVDAVTTRASGHAERLAAIALIEPRADHPRPITLAADKAYDTGDFIMELRERAVTPHVAQNNGRRRSAIDGQRSRQRTLHSFEEMGVSRDVELPLDHE